MNKIQKRRLPVLMFISVRVEVKTIYDEHIYCQHHELKTQTALRIV